MALSCFVCVVNDYIRERCLVLGKKNFRDRSFATISEARHG